MKRAIFLAIMAALSSVRCSTPAVTAPVDAEEVHPFRTLAEQCKSFDQLFFWTQPRRDAFAVYVHSDGQATIERVSGRGSRYYWDGSTAYHDDHNLESPEVVPDWGSRIADVWGECRSGFANTTWKEESPALYGGEDVATPLQRWARLELPFEWAEGLMVFATKRLIMHPGPPSSGGAPKTIGSGHAVL